MKIIIKKTWMAVAILIITIGVLSSVFRALTPFATQYKPQLEHYLSDLTGETVTIGGMETGWYWFEPVIQLKQVTIKGRHTQTFSLDNLLVGINVFRSLWDWQIQPGVIYIEDAHLTLHEVTGQWHIDGLSGTSGNIKRMNPDLIKHLIPWLAMQEKVIVKDMSLTLYCSDRTLIPITGINLTASNRGGHYKVKGHAKLNQASSSTFEILADFTLDPYHLEQTKGKVYLGLKQILFAQWQALFPNTVQRVESGQGDIDFWVELDKGKIAAVQSQLNVKQIGLAFKGKNKPRLIQSLKANLAWELKESGWQLLGDHVRLRMGGIRWPDNDFEISFNKTDQSYKLYMKSLVLESLIAEVANCLPFAGQLQAMAPHGNLHDTQIHIQQGQLVYVLSRFDKMGWRMKPPLPAVNHLSGVVHWVPTGGHLELDSKNTLIAFKDYPSQTFSLLNGEIDWKQLSHGLKLSIARLVLSQPDLTISTQGVLDDMTLDSAGHLYLVTDFSAKKLHQWLPYLPETQIKPKLAEWLKSDIKRIGQADGRMIIEGQAADFPFDDKPGIFKINSHLSGLALKITSEWPLITDIDAFLRVNKRSLEVDIVNADLQGVPLKEMSLKIDDIGHDKEELLIHGRVQGEAAKMKVFVMSSPLKKKLSMMNMLTLKGLLDLDLRLQIPLFPDSTVMSVGQLIFDNNTVTFHHSLGTLALEHLSGPLLFDEHGVKTSDFKAKAWGYPFKMAIKSVRDSNPYTRVSMEGQLTVEELRRQYDLPVLKVIDGQLSANAVVKLTNDPEDLDHMHIDSTLNGLAINLPEPLGKLSHSVSPLTVDLDFNPKKAARFRMNFDDKMSADLWFEDNKGQFSLHSGDIRLGSGYALKQNQPGVRVIGTLSDFDLEEWKKSLEPIIESPKAGQSFFSALNFIDIRFVKAQFFANAFNGLTLKAFKRKNQDWSIGLDQDNLQGDLQYHVNEHLLSGYFKRIHLALKHSKNKSSRSKTELRPEQIPNLNLRIDNFELGPHNLGQITMKSHSKSNQWILDYCKIHTPIYEMNVLADWNVKDEKNETTLHSRLIIKDLEKSLERFKIDPVVEADQGEVEFKGGWKDSIFNVSLNSIQGQAQLNFKNGRITNLSQETEEKLGLGKLLSILSLQTIPRRLKLDFSDLSQKGYSFDVFKGDFRMANGLMKTKNSYIDGPVAYASMRGSLNLEKRLYDLELKISPHITASLPIVATIAGGPIAGVATWVISKIINQGMQKISAYTYKISGPWHKPVVQQISIIKKQTRT